MKSVVKSLMIITLVGFMAISVTGCMSGAVLKESRERVAVRQLEARGDDAAIRAWRAGDAVGIGIDVSNLEALKEQPWRQAGAALLDAAMAYGAYEGIKALDDELNDSSSSRASDEGSGGGLNITVTGDANTINTVNTVGDSNTNTSNNDREEDNSQID